MASDSKYLNFAVEAAEHKKLKLLCFYRGCTLKSILLETEQGKYSAKYALSELLVCGECGTPYKRCTWARNGKKRIVWRCVSRLEFGTKYCHNSDRKSVV